MKALIIPKAIDIATIDRLLKELEADAEVDIDFVINKEINYRGFGIFPSLILLFFTWVRNKKGNFIINISAGDNDSVQQFASNFLGYSLLLSAWKHRTILDENKNNIRILFRQYTQELHKKIDFLKNLPNDNVLIPLFDHYSKEQGLSHWFYTADFKFIGSPEGLSISTHRIFEELGKVFTYKLSKKINDIVEDLDVIIWELIKNTNDHATKDHLNKIDLSPNIRGLYLKIHRSSKKKFIENSNNHIGLDTYYRNVLTDGDNFILEISVFDSGPGMVKRYLGKDWNSDLLIKDEAEIIKQCLVKGASSSSGLEGKIRGFGLNNVMKTLSKKQGFLKIRSGKVSLYRDLAKSPHFETKNSSDIELNDWTSNNSNEYTPQGYSVGTVITMSYPLNELK